jgi:hypothetical protein
MKNGNSNDIARLAVIGASRPDLLSHDDIKQMASALTGKRASPLEVTPKVDKRFGPKPKRKRVTRRRGKGWRANMEKISGASA